MAQKSAVTHQRGQGVRRRFWCCGLHSSRVNKIWMSGCSLRGIETYADLQLWWVVNIYIREATATPAAAAAAAALALATTAVVGPPMAPEAPASVAATAVVLSAPALATTAVAAPAKAFEAPATFGAQF